MRDRSIRSGTELAREIQLTDWSTVGNLSNRSSGVQIPRDICIRFGRYLYSTKCRWIIKGIMAYPGAFPMQVYHICHVIIFRMDETYVRQPIVNVVGLIVCSRVLLICHIYLLYHNLVRWMN